MDNILYWLAHADDNGVLSLIAFCVLNLCLILIVINNIFGGKE